MKTSVRVLKGLNVTYSPRILCVDDDEDTRNLIDFMLEHEENGYVITSVQNAEDALELLESRNFDLYILDCWLSEMTGIELCSRIREKDKQTPIMFFTGMARPVDREVGLAAGANEYLVKPEDISILTETVGRLLNESRMNPTNLRSAFNYKDSLW